MHGVKGSILTVEIDFSLAGAVAGIIHAYGRANGCLLVDDEKKRARAVEKSEKSWYCGTWEFRVPIAKRGAFAAWLVPA